MTLKIILLSPDTKDFQPCSPTDAKCPQTQRPRIGKSTDMESKLAVARDWRMAQEGNGVLLEVMRYFETRRR